MLLFTSCQSCK